MEYYDENIIFSIGEKRPSNTTLKVGFKVIVFSYFFLECINEIT